MEDEPRLGDSSSNVKWVSFSELADEMCPVYMSMGMTNAEYWHGDYTQLAAYRKAYELRCEQANYDAWLQGAYIYDAICAASPILHAFASKGTKALPYHKLPYGVKEKVDPEQVRAEFLAKWKANKAKWKARNIKGAS